MKKTVLLVALIAGFALTACGDKDEPVATFESPEAADKAVAAAATVILPFYRGLRSRNVMQPWPVAALV